MNDQDHAQKAADIIAALLVPALQQAEHTKRHLYVWEREGIEWLREQWRRDPETVINMWTANRYVSNTKIDLLGKMSENGQTQDGKE
jgi:hypothetical protein